jgi:hypothetical protein
VATFTITRCPVEISPECPGHEQWQKFKTCLITALYGDTFNYTTGTVDGFGRWVGLVIQDTAETVDTVEGVPVTIPAGTYALLMEDDHGFIDWQTYTTAEDAQHAFDSWAEAYGLWCEAEDAREAEIMATSGRIGR